MGLADRAFARVGKRHELRREVARVPFWWHSIDLGRGVVTPGYKTPTILAQELAAMRLGEVEVEGRSVLDIGGWDGFFAFEAERRGASRVAVLDHFMWSMDVPGQQAYWRSCAEQGVEPLPYELTEYWHPDTMPGRAGFDLARAALGSEVQALPMDFMTCDLEQVGAWDVVLYLGVLYHMEDPMMALRRLRSVTKQTAIIETEAVVTPAYPDEPFWRYFPGAELNHDISNWWAPNMAGLQGALRSVGFSESAVVQGPPESLLADPAVNHYRAIVRAER